jgi:hypothetical protein
MAQNLELGIVVLMDEHAAHPTAAKDEFGYFEAGPTECAIAHLFYVG